MALTNAERQAAFKARKAETIEALTQQNSALLAEVAELRAELDRMREKAHRLEVAQLKAQLKAKAPEKAEAESRAFAERYVQLSLIGMDKMMQEQLDAQIAQWDASVPAEQARWFRRHALPIM